MRDLLRKSGSAKYVPQQVLGMSHDQFKLLSGPLAPIESDGPGDKDEWDLFEQFLVVADEALDDSEVRHSLRTMLSLWSTASASHFPALAFVFGPILTQYIILSFWRILITLWKGQKS